MSFGIQNKVMFKLTFVVDDPFILIFGTIIDPNRWHCPYRACAGLSYKAECAIFRHIRVVHQEDFPNAKPNLLREVQTLDGQVVDFNGIFLEFSWVLYTNKSSIYRRSSQTT